MERPSRRKRFQTWERTTAGPVQGMRHGTPNQEVITPGCCREGRVWEAVRGSCPTEVAPPQKFSRVRVRPKSGDNFPGGMFWCGVRDGGGQLLPPPPNPQPLRDVGQVMDHMSVGCHWFLVCVDLSTPVACNR